MKCGLYLPNFGGFGSASVLAEFARAAEAAGWDGLFIWDHLVRPFPADVVDPTVALAAIAASTRSIRFGPLVTPLARRRPWKVARETASLDRLSGGRLVLGVGLGSPGGQGVEWDNFSEEGDLKVRGAMFDEALSILAGLWTGQPFTQAGRHYQVREAQFLPPPVQSPRVPIWVAGYWPNKPPFRRAARWDGVFPLYASKPADELAQFKEAVAYTRQQRTQTGAFEVIYASAPAAADPARARALAAAYAEAGATWWLEQLYPIHFGAEWQGEWPLEAMLERVRKGPARG